MLLNRHIKPILAVGHHTWIHHLLCAAHGWEGEAFRIDFHLLSGIWSVFRYFRLNLLLHKQGWSVCNHCFYSSWLAFLFGFRFVDTCNEVNVFNLRSWTVVGRILYFHIIIVLHLLLLPQERRIHNCFLRPFLFLWFAYLHWLVFGVHLGKSFLLLDQNLVHSSQLLLHFNLLLLKQLSIFYVSPHYYLLK